MPVLYLIPTLLSENTITQVLPPHVLTVMHGLKQFVVEDVRTARRFLSKSGHPIPIDQLLFRELNEHPKQRNSLSPTLFAGIRYRYHFGSRCSRSCRSRRCSCTTGTQTWNQSCSVGWSFIHFNGADGIRTQRAIIFLCRIPSGEAERTSSAFTGVGTTFGKRTANTNIYRNALPQHATAG